MDVAERLGSSQFYDYLIKFGFDRKTGVDLPGEAVGIMYKKDKIGPVELATMAWSILADYANTAYKSYFSIYKWW